ncbi:MAG TPA: hypothetical protein VMW63_04045 [Methanoregulaceae archaeon]|nr:hypothetical protein [Methanoregulaceae archaeon]
MKKLRIVIIGLFILISVAGFASADRGVDPTPETQGISTSTTIDAVGRFDSHTEFALTIVGSEGNGINDVPPLGAGDVMYQAVYTEDTQSNGVGIIAYDKELSIDTSAMISGQSNIEADKQLVYVGIDGGRVYSNEYIMIDGAARSTDTAGTVICPFGTAGGDTFPAYCNRVEAGSTIDMSVANVRTSSDARFIMYSGDHPVELNHDIRVTELVDGIPSQGMASAFIEALIQEAGADTPDSLGERIEFSERTAIDGDITLFEKVIHYESGMVR